MPNHLCFILSFTKGKENVKVYLKENPALRDEIELKIREHYGFVDKKKDKKERIQEK